MKQPLDARPEQRDRREHFTSRPMNPCQKKATNGMGSGSVRRASRLGDCRERRVKQHRPLAMGPGRAGVGSVQPVEHDRDQPRRTRIESTSRAEPDSASWIYPCRQDRDRGRPHGSPLPHHRAYGSVPRRFGRVKRSKRWTHEANRASRNRHWAAPAGRPHAATSPTSQSGIRQLWLLSCGARPIAVS